MKILMLSLYFEPDIAANAVIMTQLAEEWIEKGHHVTVITAFPHYAENITRPKFRGLFCQREEKEGLTIYRLFTYTSPSKESFWVRLLNYVSYNVLSTIFGLFTGPHQVIFAPSPPLTVGLSAAIIGFFKRIPYIFNVQDINPDVLIKLGVLKNPLVIRLSKGLEKFIYRRAAYITVLSQSFKENLLRKGVPEHKLAILSNFIDPDFIRPLPKHNDFRREQGIGSEFLILYAGNLGHSKNLQVVLQAADQLREHEEFHFMIVGNGSRKAALVTLAEKLELPNVTFLPFQPREKVPEIFAAADLALVTLKERVARDSVPSKVYSYMGSARPILGAVDRGTEIWNLIELQAQCGVCVEAGDTQAMVKTILWLSAEPRRLSQYGENGREYVLAYHTREGIGEAYHQLLKTITDR